MLWARQGIDKDNKRLRKVLSGDACHPFETYLSINKVKGIKTG
ncbi:hypothetical protein [Orenia metallireducens]|nr:hypothetical protein [Orenia metallireducens]